jgi:hypothetical protein
VEKGGDACVALVPTPITTNKNPQTQPSLSQNIHYNIRKNKKKHLHKYKVHPKKAEGINGVDSVKNWLRTILILPLF